MAKCKPLTGRIFMKVGDELKPMLTRHPDGTVEYFMPKEERQKYEREMLRNIAKAEADYYRNKEVSA